jgi:hypothetical protein
MIPPPDQLFETFPFAFTLKPLLIGGKAMEYHHLRPGNDYDFLIPKEEFRRLRRHFPNTFFTNAYGDAGIRVGGYAFYESQFGFIYFQLERDAIDRHDYLVAHLEFLLFLKTLTLVYDPGNQKARQDLVLLMQKLGVQPFPSESSSNPDSGETRNDA